MFGNGSPFGTPNATFGTGLFGTTPNAGGGVFGQPVQQQPTTNLFGGGGTGFGGQTTNLPVFGAGAPAVSTGAFGAPPNTTGLFGQAARPTTGLFHSTSNTTSPFSMLNSTTQAAGTSIRFNATIGTESGASSQSSVRYQCITCMKEYENKSLEELRLEDYQLNRKGPTNSFFGTNPAGTPQGQPGGGIFPGIAGATGAGTQPGASAFGQTSAFGKPAAGSLFGSLNQPKPGGLFGNTATPTSTAFGGFSFSNATTQPQPSIFGQNNNNTDTSTTGVGTSSGFSFNVQPQQQQRGSGLFGQKPLTTPVSSGTTFAGGFGSTAANTAVNKPLFGAATTAPTFGVASTANTFETRTGSLFTTNTQQPKPFSFSTPFTPAAPATVSQPDFGGFTFSNPVTTTTPANNFGTGTQPTFGGATATTGVPSSGVVCSRPEYYVKPSLEELEKMMDANGNCVVHGLEIGRVNFGRIRFLEPVNIANLNIDAVVHFRHKDVIVYPDDIKTPELGLGLNVPSEIELMRVWPAHQSTNELILNPSEIQKIDFEAKLKKACERNGSEFVSYEMYSGVWRFKVPHF